MYHKILRRLMSHPQSAITLLRNMTKRFKKCCPFCGILNHLEIHHTDRRGILTYRCTLCGKTFSELYGTIFYRSKIPLWKWCYALCRWASSTGSISSAEIGRELGLSHPAAWKMMMKIRKELAKYISKEQLKDVVEADEAWFGKKENQDIIFGLVERKKRRLKLYSIPNVKEETLYPLVKKHVEKESRFMTDQRVSYAATSIYYHHQTVNHSKKEFAREDVHTNTIEQIWGWIKGIIRTIHHGISKKYRAFYLAQFIFRYENETTSQLFFNSLWKIFSPMYCLI